MYAITDTDALIVVDPQNDFLPGGSLAVADGFRIFEPINAILPHFAYVVATRDWHPPNHAYFQERGGPWPFHCLAGTPGAEFSNRLRTEHVDEIVSKGTDPKTDGYSGFAETNLEHRLRERGIARIFIAGLATDYCVKMTAIEGIEHGFQAVVLTDAIAAVNVQPGDEKAALELMRSRGVQLATTADLDFAGRAA
jgi:nicotinamidase/pyrazinamidase